MKLLAPTGRAAKRLSESCGTEASTIHRALEVDYQLSVINSHFQKYAYSGIQVFHPSLLPLMDGWQGRFSIIDFYLSICHQVDIRCCFDPKLQLFDVGKIDMITKAEDFYLQNLSVN